MPSGLLRLLHVRPGEGGRLARVAAIGAAYAAATAIGNDVAESIFVTRVGPQSLPVVFLAKGLLDVLAAALYLPLARGRSERAVWVTAISLYTAVVIGGRAVVESGSDASAYALFIGHEAAWTILTIHWGVYLLDVFDASQARRLFPLLFTTARAGGILAGLLVGLLATPVGTANLLLFGAVLAAGAGILAVARPDAPSVSPAASLRMEAAAPEDDDDGDDDDAPNSLVATWRRAVASPLVRAIALSTAAMVLVRYGLQMIALGEINRAMAGDNTRVASFLGLFGAVANGAGILVGVFIVPRLLTRLGVGVANVLYAICTALAYALLLVWPSLATAAIARGTRVQLKDALKTPLSTLFYGAEPPAQRAGARSFIFGLAIPLATVIAAAALEAGRRGATNLALVTWGGLAVALIFVGASALQNHRWRARMIELLDRQLARAPAANPDAVAAARTRLTEAGAPESAADRLARGLTSVDPRVSALAEEVLAETVPRHRAHALAATLRSSKLKAER